MSVFINSRVEHKKRMQKDRQVYKKGPFRVCFSQKAVKSYLFCLSSVCLQHCTDRFFLVLFFFCVCCFFFWPLLNTRAQQRRFTPTLPLFTERRRRRRGPIRHGQLPSLPVWTPNPTPATVGSAAAAAAAAGWTQV